MIGLEEREDKWSDGEQGADALKMQKLFFFFLIYTPSSLLKGKHLKG